MTVSSVAPSSFNVELKVNVLTRVEFIKMASTGGVNSKSVVAKLLNLCLLSLNVAFTIS
jgi:hypothetical protein